MKYGPERLNRYHNAWPTDKGGWDPGLNVVYRGKQLFQDFNDKSWMALLMYGISGKMPTPAEARLLEVMWTLCTSFPDPRLWNNRICALAGTTRSTSPLAVGAATAVSEATVYGRKPDILGAAFLREIYQYRDHPAQFDDFVITYIKKHRSIPGFGRPVVSRDERIEPLMKHAHNLLGTELEYVELIERIQSVLSKYRYRFKPNVSIYCAALLSEVGYSPREFLYIALLSFSAGMIPCYIDALEKDEGAFFPLKCDQIDYLGKEFRRFSRE